MAAINDLINQIDNAELRERIQKEVDKLAKQKKFGLVFEEHLPECTPLYDIPVRRGSKVALKHGEVNEIYEVLRLDDNSAVCQKRGETDAAVIAVDELVTIAEFGEAIYPCLRPIDTVCNAPESDLWHALIEADNYQNIFTLERWIASTLIRPTIQVQRTGNIIMTMWTAVIHIAIANGCL